MQGKNNVLIRSLEEVINNTIKEKHSALVFGPRQVGKTTLIKKCLSKTENLGSYYLQNPEIREQFEKDPSLLIRQVEAIDGNPYIFVDEAQKVPELFDSMQYLIDDKKAQFLITGSSARKLRRKGANMLPGRVKSCRLDPLNWGEFGWIKGSHIKELKIDNINSRVDYSLEKMLVFGALPGIVLIEDEEERKDILKSYSNIYLEEEIRAESLSRKIGAFSRFLELSANESGTSPNLSKLSMEAGVSAPAIKEFYNLLVDTLVAEKVEPYLKNARKRILSSPKYYFFDIGARNAVSRMPLKMELVNTQKGTLFEHAVILEIIRRIRVLGENYKVCFWRTSGGAEVDCILDLGDRVVPIEIKASKKVALSEVKGLEIFLNDYPEAENIGFVITMGDRPEKITDRIIAVPWDYI
ncbi:ATP-binding protein [Candidatus Saganbacteria bacterium]|nr:ATP-binding protein [Candidatus Saganbacteria bacterium]